MQPKPQPHTRSRQHWDYSPTAGHETHGQSAVYDANGKDVAIVYDGATNAALIAAAPTLLELVRWSCAWANGWEPSAKERKAHHLRCLAAIAEAGQEAP